MRISLIFCAATLQAALASVASPAAAATERPDPLPVQVDHIEENRIYFKKADGTAFSEPYKTNLYDLTEIGEIQPPDSNAIPFFIFAASPCKDCVQDRSLYMIRPNGGKPTPFVYPGRIIDQKTGVVLVDSRAFYGKCLTGSKEVYVVFQKERIPRKRRRISTQHSVFVAEPEGDRLEERLIERGLPRIERTLRRVHSKECFEISGRHRTTKPLGTYSPANSGDDDEDESEGDNGAPSAQPDSPSESPAAGG